jgi:hypothetical protein
MAPIYQQAALKIGPSCTDKLNWTVTTDGGSWLSASVVGNSTPGINVGAALIHLQTGNYSGAVTVIAHDSVTKRLIGIPQIIPVALTVQPACTLQSPSTSAETFDTEAGNNPAAQTFTVAVTGTCTGTVMIVSSIISTLETGWVSVVADTATMVSGESATFTVTVASADLPPGQYEATIQLSASNNGIVMMNTTQAIDVKLNVEVIADPVVSTPTPVPSMTPTPVLEPTATPLPAPPPSPTPPLAPPPSPMPASTPDGSNTT